MALSDDQRAMLRLLAQREQGYDDIAALMGLSVDEVRARVNEALAALDEPQEAPRAVEPPPPPSPQAAAPQPMPKAEAPAHREAPVAQAPKAPSSKASSRPSRRSSAGTPRLSLPKDKRARIGLGAGAAIVAVVAIALATGALGGDDSDSPSSTAGSPDGSSVPAADSSRVTQAVLEPAEGDDASGRAIFGRFKNNVLLQVEAEGLDPSPAGQSYTIWLYSSPKLVLRIGAVKVSDSGGIKAQFPLPAELLAYVASGAFDQIDVSLTSDADYKAEVALAKRQKRLPAYTGDSVLRGEITGPAIKK